jgi:hypothetical protein
MIQIKMLKAPIVTTFVAFLLFTSCNNDKVSPAKGEVSFSFSDKASSGGRKQEQDAKSVLITIKDANGVTVAERKKLSLYNFNGEFLSEPLALSVGSFKLTEFLVLDSDDSIIYITPMENSELAYLVNDPLPIDFSILHDEVTKINPEVISAEGYSAIDFGYTTFSFQVVGTIDFLSAAFIYNPNTHSLELTDHKLIVIASGDTVYNGFKQNATTRTLIRNNYTSYNFVFLKSNYEAVYKTVTKTDIINKYKVSPLTAVFTKSSMVEGLVAHYTFVNGSSSDFSGNGNNGIVTGTISSADKSGNASESMKFNSIDDNIKISNPSFLNNTKGTFLAWVKFDDLGHTQYVGSVGDENSIESYISFLRLDGNTHTIGIYQREVGQGNWVTGSKVIVAGQYYHLAMLSDGTKWKIYINGEEETLQVINGTNNGKWVGQLTGIDNFVIGSSIIQKPYDVPYMSGNIDEVRVYNRALNAEEIQSLYHTTY